MSELMTLLREALTALQEEKRLQGEQLQEMGASQLQHLEHLSLRVEQLTSALMQLAVHIEQLSQRLDGL